MKMTVIYSGNIIISVTFKDDNEFVFKDSDSDIATGTKEHLILMMTSIGVEDLSKFDEIQDM